MPDSLAQIRAELVAILADCDELIRQADALEADAQEAGCWDLDRARAWLAASTSLSDQWRAANARMRALAFGAGEVSE
ncbi:MAG: hypothetical protein ABSB75_02025 [Candidatus Limnocylindrales bacterium]